jgi:hypothetical protein
MSGKDASKQAELFRLMCEAYDAYRDGEIDGDDLASAVVDYTDEVKLAAMRRAHEHQWTRCPNCPAGPDKPCACTGVPCCEQERREIESAATAAGEAGTA